MVGNNPSQILAINKFFLPYESVLSATLCTSVSGLNESGTSRFLQNESFWPGWSLYRRVMWLEALDLSGRRFQTVEV